jgi:hypothetical protein
VNELGNLGYSGRLLIASKFLPSRLSIANENEAVIPKSTMGGCQEPVLRVNGTRGEETTSADCIGLVVDNCSCISQEKPKQIRLARRKKCRKSLTTYVQRGPVRWELESPSPKIFQSTRIILSGKNTKGILCNVGELIRPKPPSSDFTGYCIHLWTSPTTRRKLVRYI